MENKKYTNSELIKAHNYSKNNRDCLSRSISCGCFYCKKLLMANDVYDWVLDDDGQQTALCPYCGSDSIIGDDCVYPLKKDFLEAMHKYWF